VLAAQKVGGDLSAAVERNGAFNYAESVRNTGAIRDAIAQASLENRSHADIIMVEQARGARELEFRLADYSRQGQVQAANGLTDLYKVKGDLERQAAENAAAAARDMALISRDVLSSRSDILRQASENTGVIQLEALKNKGDLINQANHNHNDLKDKINLINTDNIRDDRNGFRLENTFLKYADYPHHDHHDHHHGHHHGHHHHEDWRRDDWRDIPPHIRRGENIGVYNNVYSSNSDRERFVIGNPPVINPVGPL